MVVAGKWAFIPATVIGFYETNMGEMKSWGVWSSVYTSTRLDGEGVTRSQRVRLEPENISVIYNSMLMQVGM